MGKGDELGKRARSIPKPGTIGQYQPVLSARERRDISAKITNEKIWPTVAVEVSNQNVSCYPKSRRSTVREVSGRRVCEFSGTISEKKFDGCGVEGRVYKKSRDEICFPVPVDVRDHKRW